MCDGPSAATPRVSVILSFLDERRFLEAAVATVQAQEESDWELLLVDDGSTDGSSQIADRLAASDHRIRVLRHPDGANRGLPASRNLGFAHARAAVVALLDADDVWEPWKLGRQLELFDANPTAGMVCGPARWHFLDSDRPDEVRPLSREAPRLFGPLAFARALVWGDLVPPAPSSVACRTVALRQVGGVPAGPNMFEDQRLWVAVSMHHHVFVDDEPLIAYTVRPDSVYGAVAADGPTAWQHRVDFERWIVRRGPGRGWRVAVFAVEAVVRRWVAHLRATSRRVRSWIGRRRAAVT